MYFLDVYNPCKKTALFLWLISIPLQVYASDYCIETVEAETRILSFEEVGLFADEECLEAYNANCPGCRFSDSDQKVTARPLPRNCLVPDKDMPGKKTAELRPMIPEGNIHVSEFICFSSVFYLPLLLLFATENLPSGFARQKIILAYKDREEDTYHNQTLVNKVVSYQHNDRSGAYVPASVRPATMGEVTDDRLIRTSLGEFDQLLPESRNDSLLRLRFIALGLFHCADLPDSYTTSCVKGFVKLLHHIPTEEDRLNAITLLYLRIASASFSCKTINGIMEAIYSIEGKCYRIVSGVSNQVVSCSILDASWIQQPIPIMRAEPFSDNTIQFNGYMGIIKDSLFAPWDKNMESCL